MEFSLRVANTVKETIHFHN